MSKYKSFEPRQITKINGLGKFNVQLSNGSLFAPPVGCQLDYADSEAGIYSYKSDAGFWRSWVYDGQTNKEFVSHSYCVRLDKINICGA